MTNVDIMLDYVETISKYENMRYFVEHGKLFIGRELSKDVIKSKPFEPKIKQCYNNAQRLLLYTEELRYFEGYTVFQGIVIDHAWNVTSDNKVIDVTLEKVEEEYDKGNEEDVYYGIEIPVEFVLVQMIKEDSTNPLMTKYIKTLIIKSRYENEFYEESLEISWRKVEKCKIYFFRCIGI